MYCKNCGQPLAHGAAFCSHCGTAVNGDPGAGQTAYPVVYPEQKSRIVAGVLGILLGALGIHNFYLGYTGRALTQLLITLCTCGIGGVAMEIWALVEGIMLLCGNVQVDGKGIPLKD